MDPGTGRLYPSLDAAHLAGVLNPVEITGRPEDIERISAAVHTEWTREQKAKRNAKNEIAKASRKGNRGNR
jgi:hypothetical protein